MQTTKRAKQAISILLAAVMCLSLFTMAVYAETYNGKCGENATLKLDITTKILTISGTGEITRPWTINNGQQGMEAGYSQYIETVIIENGITSIGEGAFSQFSNILSITIPDSVTSIGKSAFGGCKSLASIKIPNSVTSIGDLAFWASGLTSIIIPNSVTSIGKSAFSCPLTSITIPDSVTSIGDNAFEGAQITSLTIPDSVTSIGRGAFYNCNNLTSVTIGNGITTISNGTFSNCTSLTSVTIPDSVTNIEMDAFRNCTSLTSITIPDSVTSIGSGAFEKTTTIYANSGSYAEKYANNNNSAFVSTGGTTTPPTLTEQPSEWAADDVLNAVTVGIVPQALQVKFTQATTRAEFCSLAVALYEKVTGAAISERETFNDTNDINIEKAAAIKVVNGVGGGNFDPSASLTREQAAAMLTRLAGAVNKPLTSGAAAFNDNNDISDWAVEAVGAMQASGIMGGVGDNTFDPQGAYTREQSIITILRLYNAVK